MSYKEKKPLRANDPRTHGRAMEAAACPVYLSLHSKSPLSVKECGMFVDAELGFLGASPDGIVRDKAATDTHGLLEIKCLVGTVSVETPASQDQSPTVCRLTALVCVSKGHTPTTVKCKCRWPSLIVHGQIFFGIHALKMALAFSWKEFLLIKISGPELKLRQSFFIKRNSFQGKARAIFSACIQKNLLMHNQRWPSAFALDCSRRVSFRDTNESSNDRQNDLSWLARVSTDTVPTGHLISKRP